MNLATAIRLAHGMNRVPPYQPTTLYIYRHVAGEYQVCGRNNLSFEKEVVAALYPDGRLVSGAGMTVALVFCLICCTLTPWETTEAVGDGWVCAGCRAGERCADPVPGARDAA